MLAYARSLAQRARGLTLISYFSRHGSLRISLLTLLDQWLRLGVSRQAHLRPMVRV